MSHAEDMEALKPFYAFLDACGPKNAMETSGAVAVSYERVKAFVAAAATAERQKCWDEINAYIEQGDLPEREHCERNGLTLACNIIRGPAISNS